MGLQYFSSHVGLVSMESHASASIDCKKYGSVMIGGFGVEGGTVVARNGRQGEHREISHQSFSDSLLDAKRILIVPGYGLAVARCQQKLADIVQTLRGLKKTVHFAIHPVAGRLPGHMNVLLAEANVPYDIVREMDEVNDVITSYDIAIVIGTCFLT